MALVSRLLSLKKVGDLLRHAPQRGGSGYVIPDTVPPIILNSNVVSQPENSGLIFALNANETVTWSIVGGADQAKFSIQPGNLLQLPAQDFEAPADANTDNAYAVTVRATDLAGNHTDQTITVSITNVPDETPPSITSGTAFSVNENSAFSQQMTADKTVTWSIVGGVDQIWFSLAGDTLNMAAKDFEIPVDQNGDNIYSVTVRATDGSGNHADAGIAVTVLDVVEGGGPVTNYTATYVSQGVI